MKAEILIRKKIKAKTIQQAMYIIKEKYPYARIVAYEFDADFRYTRSKDYDNRTMKVAFVDNFKNVWN